MRISLNLVGREEMRDENGNFLEFDRHHPMPDGEHQFIVRKLRDCWLVTIKKGRKGKPLQQAKVQSLSATVGNMLGGGAMHQRYQLTLDPTQAIFPISDLVDTLLAQGVNWGTISPMFSDSGLTDCVASWSSPHMISDGMVIRKEHEGDDNLLDASQFTIGRGATWAIRFNGTRISHIYLWMGAAEHSDKILETLKVIEVGTLSTPTYGA